MNRNALSFILWIGPVLHMSGCHHSTEPPPPVEKDPRSYTWTVDTLAYPGSYQTFMYDIWASSAANVFVVGHNDQAFGKMYHFDGAKWQPVKLAVSEGGGIPGAFDLTRVFGFSKDNIFAVGNRIYQNPAPPPNFLDSSFIVHYDGNNWTELQAKGGRELQGIWGASFSDVWSAGLSGTMFHWDGSSWTRVAVADTCWFSRMGGTSGNDVYALAYRFDTEPRDTNYYYLWHWDGQTWSIMDSNPQTYGHTDTFGTAFIRAIDGTVFSSGAGLFKKINAGWERVFYDPVAGSVLAFHGTSPDHMFLVGGGSSVYYFAQGTSYRYLQLEIANVTYYGVWTDGKEVFVVGNDGLKTYVLHGK